MIAHVSTNVHHEVQNSSDLSLHITFQLQILFYFCPFGSPVFCLYISSEFLISTIGGLSMSREKALSLKVETKYNC